MALGKNLITQEENVQVEEGDLVPEEVQTDMENEETAIQEQQTNLVQYCVFKTGREEYALPIHLIKEVVKFTKPAPLPQMPSYILGATNIRGNVFGILDIQKFFNIKSVEEHNYLLVLDHEVYKMAIGIPEVPDSIIIDEDEIEQLNSSMIKSKVGQKYLKGVIKKEQRMIILFDIEGIISSEKFTQAAT